MVLKILRYGGEVASDVAEVVSEIVHTGGVWPATRQSGCSAEKVVYLCHHFVGLLDYYTRIKYTY